MVTKPFSVPVGDEDTWSDIAIKEFDANAKAHYALLQVLNDDDTVGSFIANPPMRFGHT